ncbi:MAG TPA: ATP synthase F0 subunit B [Candidatus Angelobacter sp.]|jgi:F-type H+-transporting ATPase subunit b
MASSRQKYWINAVLALALFTAIMSGGMSAQESPKSANEVKSGQQSATIQTKDEAKAKEEEDAVRHSPVIKYIARKTGLSTDQAYWVCVGLNFAVVFGTIAVMLRKKLPGYFTGRTSTIQQGIEEARKASEEARLRLTDVEGRLSRLDTEIAAMKREAEENATAEEQRIQAAGEEERRRIVASAEQEIEMTANAARRELKSYVSELAIELAEKKIRVSKDTDEALVRAFTAQMGKDGN